MREAAVIWEGERVKWRTPRELIDLVNEAINRRLDREISAMAFKGGKPDKGGSKDQGDVLAMYRDLVKVQSDVIHALAAALAATEEVDEDEDEDADEEENEDKDKE